MKIGLEITTKSQLDYSLRLVMEMLSLNIYTFNLYIKPPFKCQLWVIRDLLDV